MVDLIDEGEDQVLRTHPELEPIVELDMKNIPNSAKFYKVGALRKCNQPQKSIGVASLNEDYMEVYRMHSRATKEQLVDIYKEPTKE